jgi:hypothetical protein
MYFFTVVTFRRQRFLIDDDVRAALREGIQLTQPSRARRARLHELGITSTFNLNHFGARSTPYG